MQSLYLINAIPFYEENVFKKALPLAEPGRRERILQIKDNKNRALSLAAGVLLSCAVNKWDIEQSLHLQTIDALRLIAELSDMSEHGMLKIGETQTNANGKPYLKNIPGLYFNLSHSGEYVLCGIADREIGVDIQQYRKNIKHGVVKKVLNEQEMDLYQGYAQKEKEAYFFRIWAAKEAYTKYTGEGLTVDFKMLVTDFIKGEIMDNRTGKKYRLQLFEELSGYAIAVVCDDMY